MAILVIDKKIDVDSAQYRLLENQAKVIINFSRYPLNSPKLLNYLQEYNELRNETRKDYLKYVAEFGDITINGKTVKELFLLKSGCSLWWFSEIVHKDSFNDPFFDDLCKAVMIKRLSRQIGDHKILMFTDSIMLNVLAGKPDNDLWRFAYTRLCARLGYLFHFCRIKMQLLLSKIKDCDCEREKITLFLSHYPQNWTYDANGKFSDRFFRDLPKHLNAYGYIINIFPGDVSGKKYLTEIENVYFVQNNIGWLDILFRFINLANLFKYLVKRKTIVKHMIFDDVDISSVFDRYMLETVILNDFCFWLHMKGAENIIKKVNPNQIICVDEFGAYSRAVIVAAHKYRIMVSWLQHAVMAKWRLWLFNMPQEICDAKGDINTDFVARMPVADRFFVWGKQALKLLPEFGYPANRTIVTGNPRYDLYQDALKNTKIKNKDLLILTPSVDRNEINHFIYLADEVSRALPNVKMVIKFHPRYRDVLDAEIAIKLQPLTLKGIEIRTDSIDNYYHNSNIIISGVSTVGIEAAYFGTKVVTMLSRYNDRFTPDWIEDSSVAYSSAGLVDKIKSIQSIRPLDWSSYYEMPGKSLKTIVSIINGISNCHNMQK